MLFERRMIVYQVSGSNPVGPPGFRPGVEKDNPAVNDRDKNFSVLAQNGTPAAQQIVNALNAQISDSRNVFDGNGIPETKPWGPNGAGNFKLSDLLIHGYKLPAAMKQLWQGPNGQVGLDGQFEFAPMPTITLQDISNPSTDPNLTGMVQDWTEDLKDAQKYNDDQFNNLDITADVHNQRNAQLQEFQSVVSALTNLASALQATAGKVGDINLTK
jgi:hypothetical protein